ncbi:DEAD/DEAH box helicase [Alphaproteobacteria bacterium]|nr:DEAD/DEAH box helicase [Alphaproteobacteria bacterium]
MSDFQSMLLPKELMKPLAALGFAAPTAIQEQTIPLALSGRDIFATSQTGTGKTVAFLLPLISRLLANPGQTALVMTPTRELAMQIAAQAAGLTPMASTLLIGGVNIAQQIKKFKSKPRIVIGTPGRINDHLERKTLRLDAAKMLVLDESDRMIDMGFGRQIDKILAFMPKDRQTLMFSATVAEDMKRLSQKYLNDPARVCVGSTTTPIEHIVQRNIMADADSKYGLMTGELGQITGAVLMFVKTRHGADRMVKKLAGDDFTAQAIHGDLNQSRRAKVLDGFRKCEYQILVATDVAARGLDVPNIQYVINYDLPMSPEDYIHRLGRTARAGAAGNAINFITKADGRLWNDIQKMMGKTDLVPQAAEKPKGKGRPAGKPRAKFAGKPGERFADKPRASAPGKPRERSEGKPRDAEFDRPRAKFADKPREAAAGKKPYRPAGAAPGARSGKPGRKAPPSGPGKAKAGVKSRFRKAPAPSGRKTRAS